MAAPHAFLDILANPQVRDAYLAGRISIILSNDLETILWANGAGARFLGFRTVADSIGVDSGFDNLTRLQIENGLTTKRGVKIGGIPNAQSFLVNAIEMDHLDSVVFLRSIAAVASDGGFVDLTDGLGDEFTEAAVLDISGNILSSTKGFRSDFIVDDELITLLYEAQSGNIIKKRLLKNYSDMPVGILELNKQPAIFLLIAAKRDDKNIDNADEVKQDFVFDTTRFPSRFAWQVDENSFFTDVSPELEICVGPRFGDIIDKSFTSLAKEWNMDSNGAMRALLKSHKAWSERKIYWPVEGGETRVEIEFSALPIYSRNREFSGYRGFGIINEAKMTAKDEGLNLARNRGPKGLTAQEHEAFTTIARKLKADILAVELPRNLRLAQSDDYQKLSSGKNSIIENVASDVEIDRAKASKVDSDATIENKSISHQPNSDQPDNNHENDYEKDIAQGVKPLADKTPSLDALQQSEEDEFALASKNDFDDSSDQTNDATETLEDSISDQPQNLTEAVEEETNNLPKFSQLPTLDEEYAFSNDDEELVSQADDSAIDSLLNHYDKSTLTGNKNAKLDDSDILPKLPERTAHTPQIATPMVVQLSKEDNLAMTELPDDDLETALEQEWANDDDLISEPLKDKSDLQNDKDNDALTSMPDDNAANIDSFEVKDNLPLHDNGEDTGRDQETNIALIGKKLAKDDDKLNAESDLSIDMKEEEEEEEEEPQTIEEALAALRRSLEANGIEAVEPRKEEVLDFWDEERSDSVETEDQLAEQASVENLAPNIDELMRQATFADDENRTAPAVLPVIDSNDEVLATDDHPPFLYPESERGPVALDNEETDEPESNVGRLNLRPADKLEIFSNDGDTHADNTARSSQDGALPIIPSPRIEFTLLQHLPLPILIYRDNRVLFASDELLQLTGFPTLDSFRAHGILSVILREWLPRNILIGSNDEIWSVRPKMRGVTWADGREASMISFGNLEKQDSIDREDFEALQRKAVELSILLNLISDGVLILDDTGLIHSVNEAAQRMFGLDADDIKGRNFIQFFSHKSVDTVNQYFDTVRQSDDKLTFGEGYEVEARRGDGDSISLFVSFGKMELDEGYFLMLRDLSVIHSAASELVVARHQAEEEALRKSRYLALVSHEIRTPLNAIIGLSELILEEKFGSLNNDRYRGYLRDIVTSGGHIMTLINDLLDAAKVAEGRTTINIGTVSIVPILKEVLGLMTPQANTGRIIMRSNIAHDLPSIAADKRSVKQIILNLLSNAIRFTPPGGQIIVSALRHENAGVLLRVRDSGIGMNENEMEEAMLPFHQISRPIHSDDDSENGNRGTGLGLPLTKALADANNARFNLYSETGKGTVAEIIFPLAVNYLDDEPIDN